MTRAPADLLAESAEELYEGAPCGYLSSLPDGTIVKVNRTLLEWLGHARETLVGQMRVHELLSVGDRIYYETHYAPLLQMQGTVREIAVELLRADGTRLPALLNSVLRRDEAGAPLLVRTTIFDATVRRSYERELLRARREAEDRARAAVALAHVTEGVVLVDADGRVEVVNAAAERILGTQAAELRGRVLADALEGWGAIGPRIPLGERDRWPTPAVLPLARTSGDQWLSVAGVDAGDGIVYTLRDVTAERRLEQIRSEVVAVVSHELRTPLAGAYGAARTLLERAEALKETDRRALLEMVVQQCERLVRIVDDVLVTSRIDAGALGFERADVDVREVVERAVAVAGAEVEVDVPAGLLAHVDGPRLEQVLLTLLDNAAKYAAGGAVRVSAAVVRRRLRLAVADEGPGIPEGEREHVFEKFYRLDPDQASGVGGVGLGLYIARGLVERMGGTIRVADGGGGATFVVELPLD